MERLGMKAPLLAIDLVVRTRREVGIGQRVLGAYDLAKVGTGLGVADLITLGGHQRGSMSMSSQMVLCDGKVEVEEKLPLSLEERAQSSAENSKKGSAIGREQGVPVLVPPVAVVAQADVFHGAFQAVVLREGSDSVCSAVGGGDDTAGCGRSASRNCHVAR
jgi:hypothetical protein